MKKYVLFVDICSSTIIMENLILNNKINKYDELINILYNSLNSALRGSSIGSNFDDISDLISYFNDQDKKYFSVTIYKYLGDGFIVLIDESILIDEFLYNYFLFLDYALNQITNFLQLNTDLVIDKIGITAGLAFGEIYTLSQKVNNDGIEYFGRTINIASRLQSNCTTPNTLIIQKELFNLITHDLIKETCKENLIELKNICNDKTLMTYTYYPRLINKFYFEQYWHQVIKELYTTVNLEDVAKTNNLIKKIRKDIEENYKLIENGKKV